MKCQKVREEMSAYLNDELTSDKAAHVEEHLLECAPCARESLRTRKLEADIRQGLEHCPAADEPQESMAEWLQKRARELSDVEKEERMNWVASLEGAAASVEKKPVRRKNPWHGLRAIAAVFLAAILLVSYWPQVVRASTQMPFIGPWIQELVLRDAGLDWAFQNGYIQENLAVVEQDGVRLTILGAVADPVHTTVIYLLDGLKTEGDVYLSLSAVNGEGIASWAAPATETSLGRVGMTQARALPAGTNVVTASLNLAELTSPLEVTFNLSREEISRLSQTYTLDFSSTVDGVTVIANSVVYTPTQVMVDFTISGGSPLFGPGRPEHGIYLVDSFGNEIPSVGSGGRGSGFDGGWHQQYVFNRPQNLEGLQLVIPALGRDVDIHLEVSVDDVGSVLDVLGSKLELTGFYAKPGTLDVGINYSGNSQIQLLSDWMVLDDAGEMLEVTGRGQEMRTVHDDDLFTYEVIENLAFEGTPARAVARNALLIVEGNWRIDLPAAQ